MPVRLLAWVLATFTLCFVQFFPLPAAAQDQPPGKSEPAPDKRVGTVAMEFGQGGFIVSASGGQGTLHFKGRKFPFKLGSLGVGGFGVSKVKATGEVFNLKRIEDFPGGYFQARAGYAAGEGKGVLRLENANGVMLKLRAITKGLALQLGVDGLKIEMGKGSKK